MAQAVRDDNRVTSILGASSADNSSTVLVEADPTNQGLHVHLAGTDVDIMLGTDFSNVFGTASLVSATPAVKVEEQGTVTVTATDLDIRDLAETQDAIAVYGSDDGGTTMRLVKTDSTGAVTVGATIADVNTGGTQTDNLVVDTELTTADLDTGAGTDTEAVVGIQYAASGGAQVVSDSNPLPVDDAGGSLTVDATELTTLAGAVSGTEMQVDLVAVTPDLMLGTDFSGVFGSGSVVSATPAVKVEEQGTVTVDLGANNDVTIDNSSIVKAEDAAHGSGDAGVMALVVRNDAGGSLVGADGDYTPLQVNASGQLLTSAAVTVNAEQDEDTAHTTGDTGNFVLAVRNDTLAALADTDGDYAALQVDAQGALYTSAGNFVSTNNSTTSTLGIGGVFTGTGDDLRGYSAVVCTLDSSHDSATDGMTFQFSTDNTNWDDVYPFTYTAADGARRFQFPVTARYFRVVYTNGGTGQTHFRVQTILHTQNQLTSIHRLVDDTSPDRSAQVMKTAIIARAAGSGDFKPVQSTAGGNLKMSVQEVSDGLDIGAGNAGSETQRVSISTDDVNLSAIKTATETIDNAISGTEMQVDVVAPLPAGTNAIGKLAANSGVDIGDVDVTSVIPGTGATNLGKEEDAGATSGDTGVAALSKRQDTLSSDTSASGDYAFLKSDSDGALWVIHDGAISVESGAGETFNVDQVSPGTGQLNLGKAEDASHGSGDVGVMGLAVRNDVLAALAGADGDYTPVQVDAEGGVYTRHSVTGTGDGVKVVTTAGTDEALAGSTACKKIDIQAQTDNTNPVAIGASGVDATEATGTGILLYPGEVYSLEVDNLADIYVDALTDGEGVRFTYYT